MPAHGVKILIIEDERDVLLYLANLLRAHGFIPLSAQETAEALVRIRAEHPALIVLDAMLPGDQSQQIYAALRNDVSLPDIPVALLSTITRHSPGGLLWFTAGRHIKRLPQPEAFLSKPPEAEDFIAVVRRLTQETPDGRKEGL